jgi:hypothetical protein
MISHNFLKYDDYVYETWILKHCVWIALSNRFWNITSNENNPRCLWFLKILYHFVKLENKHGGGRFPKN